MSKRHIGAISIAGLLALGACATGEVGAPGVPGPVDTQTDAPAQQTPAAPAADPTQAPAADATTGPTGSPAAGQSPAPAVSTGLFSAGPAGMVGLSIEGGQLVLGDVQPAEGWQHSIREQDDDEIEIVFVGMDGVQVEFEAELEEDGTLDVDVEETLPLADGSTTTELPEGAGSVTFTVANGALSVDSVQPVEGWEVRDGERERDEFEIDFIQTERQLRVELEVEIEDGRLEIETDTRYGPGFMTEDVDDEADDSDGS